MLEDDLPELDMASALTLLGDAITHRVLRSLEGTGLRPGHGYLIQRLLTGPATATELADQLGVSQQAVSKALRELLTLGHVEPVEGPGDRRRRPMALTVTGRQAVETARATRRHIDAQLRAALGSARFDATMAALLAALEALDLAPGVRRRAVRPPDGTFGALNESAR
ncbi:MarR family winged helix-turn-helix transcriptional regulator [Actinoplanes sp. URMC 104]|uniref:MarR family winged helix-turn-helix transcriptional regulator n=1 Tax=Actinoplanes sp. URMC 104 TaxID=3423409 RepID=UPI003F1A6CD6